VDAFSADSTPRRIDASWTPAGWRFLDESRAVLAVQTYGRSRLGSLGMSNAFRIAAGVQFDRWGTLAVGPRTFEFTEPGLRDLETSESFCADGIWRLPDGGRLTEGGRFRRWHPYELVDESGSPALTFRWPEQKKRPRRGPMSLTIELGTGLEATDERLLLLVALVTMDIWTRTVTNYGS